MPTCSDVSWIGNFANYFGIGILLLLPELLCGQKAIKWTEYKNSNFHFRVIIPEGSITKSDSTYVLLNLPIINKPQQSIENILKIEIKKLDSCCSDLKKIFIELQYQYMFDSIKKKLI